MTTREPRHAEPNNRPDDPRITDAVVQAAVTAGLKAPPRIEDFCRAVLGAALPLIEPAPAETVPQMASPARRRELLRKSRDLAHGVASEIVVHGFDNDEDIERVVRGFESRIAGRVYDLLEGVLIAASVPVERAGEHGLTFPTDEGSGP